MKDLRTQTTRIVPLALYSVCRSIAGMDQKPSIPARLQYFTVGQEDSGTTCAITVDGSGIHLLFGSPGCAWQYHLKPHLSLQDIQDEAGVKLLVDLLLQDPISMSIFLQRIMEIQSYLCWHALDPEIAGFDPRQLIDGVAKSLVENRG